MPSSGAGGRSATGWPPANRARRCVGRAPRPGYRSWPGCPRVLTQVQPTQAAVRRPHWGALPSQWPHTPPCGYGLVMTGVGRDDPDRPALTLARPWEHTRVGVRGLPVEAPPAIYNGAIGTITAARPTSANSTVRFIRPPSTPATQLRARPTPNPLLPTVGRSTPMSVSFTTIRPPSVLQRRPNSVIPASAALSCVVAASQTRPLPLAKHPVHGEPARSVRGEPARSPRRDPNLFRTPVATNERPARSPRPSEGRVQPHPLSTHLSQAVPSRHPVPRTRPTRAILTLSAARHSQSRQPLRRGPSGCPTNTRRTRAGHASGGLGRSGPRRAAPLWPDG